MKSSKIVTLLFPFLHTIVCTIAYEKKTEYFRVECVSDIEHCNLHVNNMKVAPGSCPQGTFCFQHGSHIMLKAVDKPKFNIDILLNGLWPTLRLKELVYTSGSFKDLVSGFDFGPICESVHLILRNLKNENSFPDIAAYIKMNPKITAIIIVGAAVLSPSSWKLLAEAIRDSPHVLTLELSGVNLDEANVNAFSEVLKDKPNSTLKSLSVEGSFKMTQNNFSNLIRYFSSLQSLSVQKMSDINDFQILVPMPHLTSFTIAATSKLSFSLLLESLRDKCPSLISLTVDAARSARGSQFTEEDAQSLGKLVNLRRLDFTAKPMTTFSKVTDAVLKAVANSLVSLEYLSVAAQSITDDSAKELANLPMLKDLSLIGSPKLTFGFLRNFGQAGTAKLVRLDLSDCIEFTKNVDELAIFIEQSPTLTHFLLRNVLKGNDPDVVTKTQKLQDAFTKNAKTLNMKSLILRY